MVGQVCLGRGMNDKWERGKPVSGGGCGEQSRALDYTVTVAGLQYHFSIFFSFFFFSLLSLLSFYFSPQFFFPFPLGGLECYSLFSPPFFPPSFPLKSPLTF